MRRQSRSLRIGPGEQEGRVEVRLTSVRCMGFGVDRLVIGVPVWWRCRESESRGRIAVAEDSPAERARQPQSGSSRYLTYALCKDGHVICAAWRELFACLKKSKKKMVWVRKGTNPMEQEKTKKSAKNEGSTRFQLVEACKQEGNGSRCDDGVGV